MSNDNTRQPDGTNLDANLEAKVNLDGIDDPAILKTKIQEEREARVKEAEAKRQILARAKAAEDKLKAIEARPTDPINKPESIKPSDILRADEFKLNRMGYNEDEIDEIMAVANRKKISALEVLKDEKNPLVLGLKVARDQRDAEANASRARDTSGTSALETKYSKADLERMKPEELEKVIGFAN